MSAITGLECKLYRCTGTRASFGTVDGNGFYAGLAPYADLDEITNVRDVQMPMDVEAADVTTRAANGWKTEIPTLKNGTVSFEVVYDASDADVIALLAAWILKTNIPLLVAFGDIGTTLAPVADILGFWADFAVVKAESNQPLTDGVKINFELRPANTAVAPEWIITLDA